MPPIHQENFHELPVTSEEAPSHPIAVNDASFGKEDEVEPTKEELEGEIRALKWLIASGNGTAEDKVTKFTAKLHELEERIKNM